MCYLKCPGEDYYGECTRTKGDRPCEAEDEDNDMEQTKLIEDVVTEWLCPNCQAIGQDFALRKSEDTGIYTCPECGDAWHEPELAREYARFFAKDNQIIDRLQNELRRITVLEEKLDEIRRAAA